MPEIAAYYRERKGTESHSYAWAKGVLAEAQLRIDLMDTSLFAADGLFPELGFYDCHACHRSMKSVQWRALPRHGGAGPGVPFINDGTFVMALALARSVAPDEADNLEAALGRMHTAGSQGIAAAREAGSNLGAVLARVESRLAPAALREREILAELLATGAEGNYLDYVSAEQAFMAVQMLVIEIDDAALEAELDALANSLDDDERFSPGQFARLLSRFGP